MNEHNVNFFSFFYNDTHVLINWLSKLQKKLKREIKPQDLSDRGFTYQTTFANAKFVKFLKYSLSIPQVSPNVLLYRQNVLFICRTFSRSFGNVPSIFRDLNNLAKSPNSGSFRTYSPSCDKIPLDSQKVSQ